MQSSPEELLAKFGTTIVSPGHVPANGKSDAKLTYKFALEHIRDIRPVLATTALVKGLLPTHGLAAIFGPSGCGKSFLAVDLALHIAAGRPWAGRKVQKSGVVYVAAEGGVGLRNRICAARQHRDIGDDIPFALITTPPNLGVGESDVPFLIACISEQATRLSFMPSVVIVDTLARVIPGADENSSRDIGAFVANADRLARAFNGLVIAVHHTGKAADRGMRGSSAFHAACDAVWEVADENGKSVRLVKLKDGPDGMSWPFGLVSVPVGSDPDGETVTTCVVDHLGQPDVSPRVSGADRKPLSGHRRALMDIVLEAIDVLGEPLPIGEQFPRNKRGIKRENLVEMAVRKGFVLGNSKDSQRAMRSNLLNSLAGDRYIGQTKDWIWVP